MTTQVSPDLIREINQATAPERPPGLCVVISDDGHSCLAPPATKIAVMCDKCFVTGHAQYCRKHARQLRHGGFRHITAQCAGTPEGRVRPNPLAPRKRRLPWK